MAGAGGLQEGPSGFLEPGVVVAAQDGEVLLVSSSLPGVGDHVGGVLLDGELDHGVASVACVPGVLGEHELGVADEHVPFHAISAVDEAGLEEELRAADDLAEVLQTGGDGGQVRAVVVAFVGAADRGRQDDGEAAVDQGDSD